MSVDRPPTDSERWIAALAYLWITALAFLLLGPHRRSRFVRFHCLQAFFYGLVVAVLHGVLELISLSLPPFGPASLIYSASRSLLLLALFLTWMLALLKAYQGIPYQLPGIGSLASKHAH